jgi:hypothetical protein
MFLACVAERCFERASCCRSLPEPIHLGLTVSSFCILLLPILPTPRKTLTSSLSQAFQLVPTIIFCPSHLVSVKIFFCSLILMLRNPKILKQTNNIHKTYRTEKNHNRTLRLMIETRNQQSILTRNCTCISTRCKNDCFGVHLCKFVCEIARRGNPFEEDEIGHDHMPYQICHKSLESC